MMVELQELAGMAKAVQEEKQEKEREVERLEQDVVLACGGLRHAWMKHGEAKERMQKVKEEWSQQENLVCVKANRLLTQDMKMLNRASERAKELQELLGENMKKFLWKTYRVVFRHIRSRSVEIGEIEVTAYGRKQQMKLCVGPYGFGLRPAVQAKEITDMTQLKELFEQQGDVARMLRRLKMNEWAKRLEDFSEIVPSFDIAVGGDVVTELEKPVVGKIATGSKDDEPKMIEKITFLSEGIQYEEKENPYYGTSRKILLRGVQGAWQALVYIQLHRQMTALVLKYLAETEPMVQRAKELQRKLEERFGRQLLASEL